ENNEVTLTLSVHADDMGMVIGRHGRIAKAIRSVMKAAAGSCGKKVNVDIKD
ncbi:MAG: KH domain-containing protein, partial [Clostridia bacterium]|nr:KH domain-containing protein [Clostridia bacterium]